MMLRLFLILSFVTFRATADPSTPQDLVGQVFISGEANQAYIKVSWKVSGEDSELLFNVYYKHVTEFEFREMSVGDNRTVTLQNVLVGEEYEVRVSSVEVSTGKMSPLSRGLAIGVYYLQEIVTVSTSGAVSITCKFAHTPYPTGCSVSLTSESDRKAGNALASKEGVAIPQATVEFTELHIQEYAYSAAAYVMADGQWLQQNRSISGTVTPLDPVPSTPTSSFFSQNFDLVTIVFLVVGVVLLPVILLILVAVLHECGKRCTQRRQGGLNNTSVEESNHQVLAAGKEEQRHVSSSHFDRGSENGSYKDDADRLLELPPTSRNSTLDCYSMQANHGSAFERAYSHSSSITSFGKALSLTDVEPQRNALDHKRRVFFKGSFPFVAVRRESTDEEPLSKAYSCDTGLNTGADSSRPLGKRLSVSRGGSEDTISLRTSLFNILAAFDSQVISVPQSSGTIASTDKEDS